jgi:hypothetical protein
LVAIGACLEQQIHDFNMTSQARPHKGRLPVSVALADACPGVDQHPYNVHIVIAACVHQWGNPVGIEEIWVIYAKQQFHYLCAAVLTRSYQGIVAAIAARVCREQDRHYIGVATHARTSQC